jgi:TOMM system kinase/cyclase fusion protein
MPDADAETFAAGSIFEGRYEILSELGEGSFGRVYKARQLSTAQPVAIKILRHGSGDSEASVARQIERFRREMHLCAELSHPHIVRLIDSGESDRGGLYAVFEFVPGETLEAVLAGQGTLGLREALHLMTQVLDALACAHRRGVVHRDLKPANIMVTATGARRNALVLDFGLGGFAAGASWELPTLTRSREFLGTPSYAAPEQLRGEPATTRSDLYSWGLILLECLTGESATDRAAVFRRLERGEPIPLPAWLESHRLGRLLRAVTAPEVEKRDVTIEGLLQTLEVAELGERAHAHVAAPESPAFGKRQQVTIVSCRLVRWPAEPAALDVEEREELMRAQQALLAEIGAREGGRVAGSLGDRILLHFGFPHAREDDARRACRIALEIAAEVERRRAASPSGRGIGVCIGVHTGLVIARAVRGTTQDGSLEMAGATPEIATELDARARPGEVLVSADTQRLLQREIHAEALGEQVLDALGGPVPTFRLSRAGAATLEPLAIAETPLLGRTGELAQLLDAWNASRGGTPRHVLVTGDAGIGKSRLLRELRRKASDQVWLECRCAPEHSDSPLRPVVELLSGLRQPLESLLPDPDPAQVAALRHLLTSGSDPQAVDPPMSRERQKELTLQALVALLLRQAAEQALVLAVEDLQYADPTSLELFGRLAQEVQTAQLLAARPGSRLLFVCTARSEFTPPWPHAEATRIHLSRLPREDVEAMVEACVAGRASVSHAVLERILQRADGVPLFVEEVARMLVQQEDPYAVEGATLEIPTTLRGLLLARLDALSPDAGETAQLAAALGREFRYELLRAASPKDEATLREDLREIARAGLLVPRRGTGGESYVFKHALVRDAAYESMLKSTRRAWHARIAHVLRERFADVERRLPELLALHFGAGGEPEAAAEYWKRAGDRASGRGAYIEAIHHYDKGLEVLRPLEPSRNRTRHELTLTTARGSALVSTRGYAAPEVEQAFAQARRLCHALGEEIPLRVLYGTWGAPITRGELQACDELIPHFRRLAETRGDPLSQLALHAILATYHYFRGSFREALDASRRALDWYREDQVQAFAREIGDDLGMHAFGYHMSSLSSLGYEDQAVAVLTRMLSAAQASGNPYGLAVALGHAMNLRRERGEFEIALEMAERQIALAMEQRLFHWLAPASVARGWVLARRGKHAEGIAQIQQGLDLFKAIGVRTSYQYLLCGMAEAQLWAGNVESALAVLDEGLAMCEKFLDRCHEGELLRLKGECLLRQGDPAGAEDFYRRALAWARERAAKPFELRAARSLSQLLAGRGERDGARELLRGVYAWFQEGHDTLDLREAREQLAALA